MLVALIAAHDTANAAETTVRWVFDQGTANGYINMDNYQGYFPNGMVLSSTDKWGWYSDGTQGLGGGRCLRSGANSIKADNVIVFYAHKGTIAFTLKGRFVNPTLAVWTATESAGNYQLEAELLNSELGDVGTSEYATHSITVENDGYVAFTAINAYINDISNTYEESAATYSISGTVKSPDGAPIQDATVALLSASAQTDAQGNFTLAGIAEGEYDMTVSKDGYKTASTRITVNGADVSGIEVTLGKTVTTVKGIVMDMMNYSPIAGAATVTFMTPESEVVAEAVMDGANYSVTLEGTVLPTYKVKVSPRYYEEVIYDYSIWKPGEENVRNWIVNYKKISFSLSLKSNNGLPLSGASVTLTKAGTETTETAAESTTEPGTYTIGNMNAHVYADDIYVIRVAMPNYTSPTPLEFRFDGKSYAGEMTLTPIAPTVICGNVTDEEGAPVATATVMLSDGSPVPLQTVSTDGEGHYSISIQGEPAEQYTLIVYADYYEGAAVPVTDIAAAQENTVDVSLTAVKYTFTATVKDKDTGTAITDAVVRVSDGETVAEAAHDGDGNYTYTVAAVKSFGKTYTVSVEAEGYYPAEAYAFSFAGQDVSQQFLLTDSKVPVTGAMVDGNTNAEIYTMTGIRARTNATGSLPAGIYHINGKKVLVK